MRFRKIKPYLIIGFVATLIAGSYLLGSQNSQLETGDSNNEINRIYDSLTPQARALYYAQSDQLTKAVPRRIVELDELTIGCFGPSKVLGMSTADTNLGGQCCGTLKDAAGYKLQLEVIESFIKKHGGGDFIPKDPYDISVKHAQQLTSFDINIVLTPAQQAIYDEAMKNSHHGGPCCCKCWKWYVMSGLAKKMIVDYKFTHEDVSELWDISSSCGHDEDINYSQHYKAKEDHSH